MKVLPLDIVVWSKLDRMHTANFVLAGALADSLAAPEELLLDKGKTMKHRRKGLELAYKSFGINAKRQKIPTLQGCTISATS